MATAGQIGSWPGEMTPAAAGIAVPGAARDGNINTLLAGHCRTMVDMAAHAGSCSPKWPIGMHSMRSTCRTSNRSASQPAAGTAGLALDAHAGIECDAAAG
jgi:hypothetical protein